jgi:hypothetical protein
VCESKVVQNVLPHTQTHPVKSGRVNIQSNSATTLQQQCNNSVTTVQQHVIQGIAGETKQNKIAKAIQITQWTGHRTENREQRAGGREQRAESREQKVESREHKKECKRKSAENRRVQAGGEQNIAEGKGQIKEDKEG